jgi:hypothetical protein
MVLDDGEIVEVETLKGVGAEFFKGKEVASALQAYEEALAKIGAMNFTNSKHQPELLHRVNALRDQLSVNSALCCVKLEKYEEAIASASIALTRHEETRHQETKLHVKALYLRGKAHAALNTYCHLDCGKKDLLAACKLAPKDKMIRKELDGAMKSLKEANEKEKAKPKKKAGFFNDNEAREGGDAADTTPMYEDREKERVAKKKEKFEETVAETKYSIEREEQAARRKEKVEKKALKEKKAAKVTSNRNDYSRFDIIDSEEEEEDEPDVAPPAHIMKGRPKESSINSMEVPQGGYTESDDDDIECTFGK